MSVELLPEIWTLVFSHLRNPTSLPLSSPPRSQLRQPHLAVVQRVCKTWEHLSEPLLYSTIVTDDLASLFTHIHSPSMRRRLARTHTLYLEHLPANRGLTYQELCRTGGRAWKLCGRSEDLYGIYGPGESSILTLCRVEAEGLELALGQANKLGMKAIFPKLERLAVQSLYGESDTWDLYGPNGPIIDTRSTGGSLVYVNDDALVLFNTFIASGNLKHYCVRSNRGPLSPPLLSYQIQQPTNFTRTIHFGRTSNPCLHLGAPTKWVCDVEPSADWAQVLHDVAWALKRISNERARDLSHHLGYDLGDFENLLDLLKKGRVTLGSPSVADLEIYCSTSHLNPGAFTPDMNPYGISTVLGVSAGEWEPGYLHLDDPDPDVPGYDLSVEQQDKVVKHLNMATRESSIQNQSGRSDSIRWYPSRLSPICETCGTGAPRGSKL